MTKIEDLVESAIIKWKNNNGVGTLFVTNKIDGKLVIRNLLERFYSGKNNTAKAIVICDNYADRMDVAYTLTHSDNEYNNTSFAGLMNDKILSVITLKERNSVSLDGVMLFVAYNIVNDIVDNIANFANIKFRFIYLNDFITNNAERNRLYSIAPNIVNITNNDITACNVNSPVEKRRYGVVLTSNDKASYDKYTAYITQSINIFGSFEIMEKARSGDNISNTSSAQYRERIAHDNGWSPNLNMDSEFNKQIDQLYNPNALYDRSLLVYDIIRKRNLLLTDNEAKLEQVINICKANIGKKILIISKRGEFAAIVTNAINANISNINIPNGYEHIQDYTNPHPICMNYHDKVDSIPSIDDNGNFITVKSGANKGKPKMIAAKAQQSLTERLFNSGYINVLSTNNSCPKGLQCDIDIVIFTSPLCDSLNEFKHRVPNVYFRTVPNIVYTLYMVDTTENSRMLNAKVSPNETITDEEINIGIGENNSYNIVAD